MPKYKVEVTKITEKKEIFVNAETHKEAEDKVLQLLSEGLELKELDTYIYKLRSVLTVGE